MWSAKQTEFQDTKPTKPERKCGNKIKKQETDTKKFNKATKPYCSIIEDKKKVLVMFAFSNPENLLFMCLVVEDIYYLLAATDVVQSSAPLVQC